MSTGTDQNGHGPVDTARRLKAQIDSYPVRLPPGLAREAFRAHRRHRARRRSIVAVGVVVVIAAGAAFLAAGTIPFSAAPGGQRPVSPPSPGVIPAQGVLPPASLQPSPPGNSLTTQQAARDIQWTRTTYTGPSGPGSVSATDQFHYGRAANSIAYLPGGKPYRETHSSEATGPGGTPTSTITTVDYAHRTWSRETVTGTEGFLQTHSSCQVAKQLGLMGIGYSTNLWPDPASARALPGCLGFPVTQGQRIDGVDAITITDPLHVTLWLNATTYLPIQLVNPATHSGQLRLIQFGFLPPTSANLAYLAAYLPHGFTHGSGPFPVAGNDTSGPPARIWQPPAGVIPPFGLQPAAAGDGLTASQAAGDIEWVRTTTSAIPASDTVVDSTFSYRSASRDLTYTPSGQPWDDSDTYVTRGADGKPASVDTVVLYDRRTVSVQATPDATSSSQTAADQDVCGIAQTTGLANIVYPLTADQARSLLSCKGQVVTRGLTFDGVGAIKVAGRLGETLWINAATGLPIEIMLVEAKGQYPPAGYNNAKSPGRVIQFTWLPPTPANLAYLGIPIPPGFTKTS